MHPGYARGNGCSSDITRPRTSGVPREHRFVHFQAEAGFVIRINELSEKSLDLSDDGSYITLSNWKDPTHKDPTRLSLTVFPVSADRFRHCRRRNTGR